jgi:lipoprotein-anchoring transpeptidase ErfK/SrfK
MTLYRSLGLGLGVVAVVVAVVWLIPRDDGGEVIVPPPAVAKVVADPPKPVKPAIPTVTLPCVAPATELVTDGKDVVLCWPGGACWSEDHEVPRPAPTSQPAPVPTTVEAERVCTGMRCDPIGKRLAAAIHGGTTIASTRDHAAIVVDDHVWNRARDGEVALPSPVGDEGGVEAIQVLGDRVLVSRSCQEFCSHFAKLIDANGRSRGPFLLTKPGWRGEHHDEHWPGFVDLGEDHFLVIGQMGELALVAGGQVVAEGFLMSPSTSGPHPADLAIVVVDGETLGYRWCDRLGCHVGKMYVQFKSPSLSLNEERQLPSCPDPGS